MTDKPRAATDAEIAEMVECLAEERHEGFHFCEDFGCTTMRPFILRIAQERALSRAAVEALKDARAYYVHDNRLGGREKENAELVRWDAVIARAAEMEAEHGR
jgi:hypothetical protein